MPLNGDNDDSDDNNVYDDNHDDDDDSCIKTHLHSYLFIRDFSCLVDTPMSNLAFPCKVRTPHALCSGTRYGTPRITLDTASGIEYMLSKQVCKKGNLYTNA